MRVQCSTVTDGIVHELQRAANDRSKPTADLLRLALTAASKLGLAGTSQWIRNELTGYAEMSAIPPYRHLRGKLHVQHPFRGNWNPVSLGADVELADALEVRRMDRAIAYLDDLAAGEGSYVHSTLPDEFVEKLHPKSEQNYNVLIPKSSVVACLDTVRTAVLEWALDLEAKGIHGEGYSFTAQEKRAAVEAPAGITFAGNVGTAIVQQNPNASPQTVSLAPPKSDEKKKTGLLAVAQGLVDLWNKLPKAAQTAIYTAAVSALTAIGTWFTLIRSGCAP